MSNLFWPYIGFRHQNTGAGEGSGKSGIFWTAKSATSANEFRCYIYGGFQDHYDDYLNPRRTYRYPQDGLGARCVKIKSTN